MKSGNEEKKKLLCEPAIPTSKEIKKLFKKYPPQFDEYAPKFKVGQKVVPRDWATQCDDWSPDKSFEIRNIFEDNGSIILTAIGKRLYEDPDQSIWVAFTENDALSIDQAKMEFVKARIKYATQEIKIRQREIKRDSSKIKKVENLLQKYQSKLAKLHGENKKK